MDEHKVLIIACGGKKHSTEAGPLRAIDLYAGRQFGLAKRLEALGWTVVVLSAKHGLVHADRRLESYDLEMDAKLSKRAVANIETGRSISAAQYAALTAGAERVTFYGGTHYFRVWWALDDLCGPATYDADGRRACEKEHIVGAGCGDHYSVLKALVEEEEAAARAASPALAAAA